jgi:hypothetical protein
VVRGLLHRASAGRTHDVCAEIAEFHEGHLGGI